MSFSGDPFVMDVVLCSDRFFGILSDRYRCGDAMPKIFFRGVLFTVRYSLTVVGPTHSHTHMSEVGCPASILRLRFSGLTTDASRKRKQRLDGMLDMASLIHRREGKKRRAIFPKYYYNE
jgi:hypothetical protein